jgi:predicted nucleic acid-binding protein
MIYIDTSCLVKLLRSEPESAAVTAAALSEQLVIVSSFAELEALVELKGAHMGGDYSLAELRRFEAKLAVLRNHEPFSFRPTPGRVWETAFRQHRNSGNIHCRAFDRLHLAAVEEFGASRLMTLDKAQANAARALRFEVIQPL